MSPWILLALAIGFEIAATLMPKLSHGFEKWQWGMGSMALYATCFWVLAPALKTLPVGVVYALWAGLGIVGASVLGLWLFEERLAGMQYMFVALILVGAVGLRLSTPA